MFSKSARSKLAAGVAALAIGLTLGVSLTACASSPGGPGGNGGTGDDGDGGSGSTEPTQITEEQVLGDWISNEVGDPRLSFEAGGKLSGTDGCNGIGGEWKLAGDAVTLELGPSTLKACPGVDTWLRGATSVTIDGDTMTVLGSPAGEPAEEIGELQRT